MENVPFGQFRALFRSAHRQRQIQSPQGFRRFFIHVNQTDRSRHGKSRFIDKDKRVK